MGVLKNPRWRRSRRLRLVFAAVYLVFVAALAYGGWKACWYFGAGVPVTEIPRIWDLYYPQIRHTGVLQVEMRPGDGRYDLVLLGASSINRSWSRVDAELIARMTESFGNEFNLFNLSEAAHTSRDSRLKFSLIERTRPDVVILYDGINDARMNNCPRERFRDDYTHCAWYNGLQQRLEHGKVTLPQALLSVQERAQLFLSLGSADPATVAYGRDLKTPGPFRRNIEEIVDGALANGSEVVLMTFAVYVPENYSLERFKARELGYGPPLTSLDPCPLELWGEPEAVLAAVRAHNEAIREIVRSRPSVAFVDQEALMPARGSLYVDPCHFTEEGSRKFVENLFPTLEKLLRKRRP